MFFKTGGSRAPIPKASSQSRERVQPWLAEIAKAMAWSFENLRENINVDRAYKSTTFDLDGPAADLVSVALGDLRFIAPFVLAFNPAIGSIEIAVDDVLSLTVLARHIETRFGSAHLVECGDMSTRQVEWRCCLVDDADLAIAIPLGGSSASHTIAIPETLPRLFVAFPLFGTEQLPLPFVLNCMGKPTEKRDGLFFGHEETDDNQQNKQHFSLLQIYLPLKSRASLLKLFLCH